MRQRDQEFISEYPPKTQSRDAKQPPEDTALPNSGPSNEYPEACEDEGDGPELHPHPQRIPRYGQRVAHADGLQGTHLTHKGKHIGRGDHRAAPRPQPQS